MGRPVSIQGVGQFSKPGRHWAARAMGSAETQRACRPPCPGPPSPPAPQPGQGQADPRFAEHRNRPWESEQPLFPAEEVGEGRLPEPPGGENSGRGLINRTDVPAKWLCSFAFTIGGDQHTLPWLALAGAWRGGGRGGSPCSGETCQLLGLVRRQRRQTQCCCCWFDL